MVKIGKYFFILPVLRMILIPGSGSFRHGTETKLNGTEVLKYAGSNLEMKYFKTN